MMDDACAGSGSPRSPVSRELKGLEIESPVFQRGAVSGSRLRSGKELW